MSEKVAHPDAVQRVLASPPGWPLMAIIVMASGLTLWQISLPGSPDIFISTMAIAGWLALGVFWLLRLVVYLFQNRIRFPVRGHRLQWCVIPLIVIVTAAMTVWLVPLRLRFAVGESELERFAQQVITEGPRQVDKLGRIGTYEIAPWSVERFGEGAMRFMVEGQGRVAGLAYSPNRSLRGRSAYYQLEGPWYVWVPHF